MAVIGVDVDGIVANFESGYAPLLTKVSGIEFPRVNQPGWPDTWFWDAAAGVTKEQEAKVWKEMIIPSDDFWFNLPAHIGAAGFLASLNHMQYTEHDVYFITNRPGLTAKGQTEEWLVKFGVTDPTVLISGKKGLCCKALDVTHYIDDKTENCEDVSFTSPSTQCFMLAKAYNRPANYVTRISTLQEFIDAIEK